MERTKAQEQYQPQVRLHLAFGGSAGIIASIFLSLLIAFQVRDHFRFAKGTPLAEIFSQAKIFSLQDAIRKGFTRLSPDPTRKDILLLRERNLLFPVQGFSSETIRDSFLEPRSGGRVHHAADIPARRNTPVLAVEDGTITRLLYSKMGGITIYQSDPTSAYFYYYAHLDHYADKLKEGDYVRRGQVIGYVGNTGNASGASPHLHFALHRKAGGRNWGSGIPINPYQIYK